MGVLFKSLGSLNGQILAEAVVQSRILWTNSGLRHSQPRLFLEIQAPKHIFTAIEPTNSGLSLNLGIRGAL